MAAINPAVLLRMARTNQIASVLRRRQDALNPGNILPPNDRGGLTGSSPGTLVPNAGLYGTPAPLPTDPGPVEPPILTGQFSAPGPSGNDAQNLNNFLNANWFPSPNSPYLVSGYGTQAPTGIYAPGAGPTMVPTFWGNQNGAGGGNFSMGGPPPTPASKAAGHRASYWVF